MYDSATSKTLASNNSGVVIKGDNIYLDHTEDSAFSNLLATQTENVNPFNVISAIGNLELSPASDEWKESRKIAPKVLDGGVKIDKSQANNWNNWEWNWSGTEAASLVAGQELSARQTENQVGNQIITYKQTNYVASNEIVRTFIGSRVIDIALIPFMRSKKVFFRAQGLKSNSRMFAFFNGVDVSDWVRAETGFTRYSTLDEDFGSRTASPPARILQPEMAQNVLLEQTELNLLILFNPHTMPLGKHMQGQAKEKNGQLEIRSTMLNLVLE